MIKIEKAYDIIIDSVIDTGTERIDFRNSLNRVLAEDVHSDIEMPPFDKSAMDGFACRRDDLENQLQIVETVPAGKVPQKKIGKNQCARIMTGAPVPEGADCVVMVEHTEEIANDQVKINKIINKDNISYKGEDVRVGDLVLRKGIIIEPKHLPIFAAVGYTNVLVGKKPKVGVISTGDELVEPQKKPGISQIRNTNSYQLMAQSFACGAEANYYGIAEDTEEATYRIVNKALEENDVVLLTGGVSMGSFDFVPKVLKKAGLTLHFDTLAVKPGKPTTFATGKNKRCFGLPGNPVSSFMQFDLLVKPMLFKMMGCDYKPVEIYLPMGVEYKRKKTDRKSYMPVKIENGEVIPVEYHGSAHIHALSLAQGIISIPIGKYELKKGEKVHVRQI